MTIIFVVDTWLDVRPKMQEIATAIEIPVADLSINSLEVYDNNTVRVVLAGP